MSKVLGTCCETSAPSPRILPSHTRGINSVTARRGSRWRENRVWVGFPDGKRRRRSVPTFESDGSRATPDGRASGVPVTRVYIRRPNDLAVSVDTRTEKYSSLSRPWQSPRRRRRRYGSVEREIRPAAGGYGRRSGPSTTRPSAAAPDAVDVDVRSRRPPVDLLRRRLLPPPPAFTCVWVERLVVPAAGESVPDAVRSGRLAVPTATRRGEPLRSCCTVRCAVRSTVYGSTYSVRYMGTRTSLCRRQPFPSLPRRRSTNPKRLRPFFFPDVYDSTYVHTASEDSNAGGSRGNRHVESSYDRRARHRNAGPWRHGWWGSTAWEIVTVPRRCKREPSIFQQPRKA